jgi:phosphoribosylamine--glycine ligase
VTAEWSDDPALTVVMASKGYPGSYEKNTPIHALPPAGEGTTVFHAGTALKDGVLVATGGRVLNVTATGKTVGEAKERAYALLDKVEWENGFCRRDIGWRAVAREKA